MKSGQDLSEATLTQELTRLAVNGMDVERCLAIRALALEPLSEALPALRKSRTDQDEDVRFDAVTVMAELADASAATDLLDSLLEDPSLDVKAAAIDGLGKLRAGAAVDTLCQLALEPSANMAWDGEEFARGHTDPWLELQRLSVKALGSIGDPKAIEPIVTATHDEFAQDLWPESLDALMGLGKAGIDVVISQLSSKKERVRRLATERLAKQPWLLTGEQLVELTRDPSVEVRRIAVSAIEKPDEKLISELMSDADATVRETVLWKFCVGNPKRISKSLGDPAPRVQAAALRCLAQLQHKPEAETAERLLRSLLEKDGAEISCAVLEVADVLAPACAGELARTLAAKRAAPLKARRTAIGKLSDNPEATGLNVLTSLVGDPIRSIRLSALDALSTIANRKAGKDTLADAAANTILAAFRGELIAPPVESTRSQLTTDEPGPGQGLRRHGTDAAGDDDAGRQNPIKIDREGNIVELPEAKEAAIEPDGEELSSQPRFARSTLDAIQGINGGGDSVQPEMLEDVELTAEDISFLELAQGKLGRKTTTPDPKIPIHADATLLSSKLLAKVARRDVVEALIDGLKSTNPEIRVSVAASLAAISRCNCELFDDAIDELAAHLGDQLLLVRLNLVRSLGHIGDRASAHLESALEDAEPAIQAEAVAALATRLSIPDKEKLLGSSSSIVRKAAADALAKSGGEREAKALRDYAFDRDGEGALHAFGLLRKLDQHTSEHALVGALTPEADPRRRQIALGVLAAWAGHA